MRTMILLFLFVAVVGCKQHTPTPTNTTIITKDDFDKVDGTSEKVLRSVTLEDDEKPTDLDIEMQVITKPDGSKHFISVIIRVKESGGWEVSGGGVGNLFNIGTESTAVMAFPVIVSRYKATGCGTRIRQASLTLSADGTVKQD